MGISVIIPCYNHGEYLKEAIESTSYLMTPYEVIIVNDGSTDDDTLMVLEDLKAKGVVVLDQENSGPSKARNKGIRAAKYPYVLPLDADNKINSGIYERAEAIMEGDENISVVYTDAEYIGERQGVWKVGELDAMKILLLNQIDTCSLIRKSDLLELGGYDENRDIMSNEDWELWLRMLYQGKKFYYLDDIGFQYRVSNTSLSATIAQPMYASRLAYLVKKYPLFYTDNYRKLLDEKNANNEIIRRTRRYIKNHKVKAALKILLGRKLI